MKLTLTGARALLLAAQGLGDIPARPADKTDVLATIRRMGLLQIDTISVVARSPYLVLWSRLGAYDPRWLDQLLAEGALFEYWSHAACFLPIEDFPLYRRLMLEYAERNPHLQPGHPEHHADVGRVLTHIREQGEVRSIEFTRDGGKSNGWWDWKPEKLALERLYYAGVLMIARRDGFQRVYDLRERVLPNWDDERTPQRAEGARTMALKAVAALGVATSAWVRDYFKDYLCRSKGNIHVARMLEALVAEGSLLRTEIEGVETPAYVHPANLELALRAAEGTLQSNVTTLLSPFDPVVSDRARALKLFGFEYRIETYTPAEKRRYGYFTLPILHRGQLVGRLDPKAHRRTGMFEVRALHLEPGVAMTEELIVDLTATLRTCAAWHETPNVVIGHSDPPELASQLETRLAQG
jgi:uncharacterized protein YcaQ